MKDNRPSYGRQHMLALGKPNFLDVQDMEQGMDTRA
jgi:hypothetical protein